MNLLRKTRLHSFALVDFKFLHNQEPVLLQVIKLMYLFQNRPETVDSKEVLNEIYLFN